MNPTRFPVLFLSHGGGPWPWVDGMKQMFAKTAREFAALPSHLPIGTRRAHPREDHLLPVMVVAGTAGADRDERVLLDHAMNVDMASYQFPPRRS
jgi:aromatic ring-opening dioxygenase catalytic subunit (LigB family)